MQKIALRHFKKQATSMLSSSLTSNDKMWASILKMKKIPFTSDVKATLPAWYRTNLHSDIEHGSVWLKYQFATEEHSIKWLHPWKKKISHTPVAKKTITMTTCPESRDTEGKVSLFGKENVPFEYK